MTDLTRRSVLATGAVLAVQPAFAQPAHAQSTPAPQRGGTLRVSVDQAIGVLNPLLTRVNPEYLLAELLYSALTRLAPDMSAVPDLAQSWSSNAELTEWTFKLRPGVMFSDGSPCTARDVAASFAAIMDPKTASPAHSNVGPIAEVVAQDPLTAVFKLRTPYADLPVALAYTNAKIVPADGGLERLTRTAVGTGPFTLQSFEPDRRVVVVRNERYYDPARPFLDRIELLVYPDPTAETSALISGDTDLMSTTPSSQYERLTTASGVVALRTPSGQFLNVNMRCDQKPFDDPRVRLALALTVDRTALVGFIAQGYGTPGNDTPINSAYRFYRSLPQRGPDVPRARQLLAQAGYPGGLDLTLIASDRPGSRTQLGVAMREMAKPAGFRIAVQTMPHATYLDQVWKKGKFYVGFYNMQATADAIYSLLYTSDSAWNETRWNNAAFDKLVHEARMTTDEPHRAALYGQAQMLMYDQVPSVIPVFFDLLAGRRIWVEGYVLHPRGAVFGLDNVSLGKGAPQRS